MTWDPHTYPATIRAEVHDYERLQAQVLDAARGASPASVLDLGVGAGETAARVLRLYPEARLVGVDSSAEMLEGAAAVLPRERVTLVRGDLGAPLPEGPFDLVVSALAIHHLEGELKRDLFARVAAALAPGGRFVMGDVIVPDDPADVLIEHEPGYDFPSPLSDQLGWMHDAGLSAQVVWLCRDLAVVRAARAR
jgi:tRNA (cmo5U34)-methyltransferase